MPDKLIRLISTFFYTGYFPVGSGTFASFIAMLLALSLSSHLIAYVAVGTIFTILGFVYSGRMEFLEGKKDPGCVVIDEVAGIFLTFFLLPLKYPVIITAFFLFRAMDMFKLYPANKFEQLGGGLGIMMDDVFAGFYANIVMQIAIRLAHIN
ncbi:MAG: phosphatidylglycerophosphatase A [Candidatus Omnitrophica bacterium]|nr:phosphatidylglycerophosphatase A [Candidatus Omnitrophota bacterium]